MFGKVYRHIISPIECQDIHLISWKILNKNASPIITKNEDEEVQPLAVDHSSNQMKDCLEETLHIPSPSNSN